MRYKTIIYIILYINIKYKYNINKYIYNYAHSYIKYLNSHTLIFSSSHSVWDPKCLSII